MSNTPLGYEPNDGQETHGMPAAVTVFVAGIASCAAAILVPALQVAAGLTDVRNRHVLLINAMAVLVGGVGLTVCISRARLIWRYRAFVLIASLLLCCGGIGRGLITFAGAGLLWR
jgi:hypothetical protein